MARILLVLVPAVLAFTVQPIVAAPPTTAPTAADLKPVRSQIMIMTRRHHCLDIENGQTKNGAKVQFSVCHGKANQRWTLTNGGYLVSQQKRVRKCLSVPVNLLRKGTALRLWDCQNVAGQRWFFKNNRLFLFDPKKALCVTTRAGRVERSGDTAVLGLCAGKGGMALKRVAKMPLPLNPVQLQLQKSSFCIDKSAGLKNGVAIRLQACRKKETHQRFKLEKQRDDYIQIQSVHSGKCLSVADASKKPNTPVQQWSCLGYDNQLWKKIDYARGWFALKAKHSGLCLTAVSHKKKYLHILQQRKCKGLKATQQLFKMSR